MHRLFDDFAHRYDLHTPPGHYQHDHAFVLEQAAALGEPLPAARRGLRYRRARGEGAAGGYASPGASTPRPR